MGGDFADAVDGAVVEAGGAVGLRLKADTYVLNGAGDDAVSNTREGAREVVLGVA